MTWTECDSALYQELAAVGVPDRAEQMAHAHKAPVDRLHTDLIGHFT